MPAPRVIRSLREAFELLGKGPTLRAMVRDDWYRGDLRYRMSVLQERVRGLCYGPGPWTGGWLTSRRGGKTRTGAGVSVEKSLQYPGIYIPYAAPTAEQVRNFVNPHLYKIADEAPPELAPDFLYGRWIFPPLQWYDAEGREVRSQQAGGVELARFRGEKAAEKLRQSVINPKGCEDTRKADALRGTGTVFSVIDEARDIGILPYVIKSIMVPMLTEARTVWGMGAFQHMLVITTAPKDPTHPFVAVWNGLLARGRAIHTNIYDALEVNGGHLLEEDVEQLADELGGKDTADWRREAMSIIERDPETSMFPEFNRELHVAPVEQPEHFLPAIIGDWGHVDLAWFGFGWWNFLEARIEVVDELIFKRGRADEMGAALQAKADELWPDTPHTIRRRVDAKPQTRLDLNRPEWGGLDEWDEEADGEAPHWQFVTKPKGRRGQGSLESGVNRFRTLLNRVQVRIDPRCVVAIEHLEGAVWDRTRTEPEWVKDPEKQKERLHHFDAAVGMVYFARDVDRTTNPAPDPRALGFADGYLPSRKQAEPEAEEQIFGRRGGKKRKRGRGRR